MRVSEVMVENFEELQDMRKSIEEKDVEIQRLKNEMAKLKDEDVEWLMKKNENMQAKAQETLSSFKVGFNDFCRQMHG